MVLGYILIVGDIHIYIVNYYALYVMNDDDIIHVTHTDTHDIMDFLQITFPSLKFEMLQFLPSVNIHECWSQVTYFLVLLSCNIIFKAVDVSTKQSISSPT